MKKFIQIITVTMVIAGSVFFLAGQSLDYFVFKYRQSVIQKEIKKEIKNGVAESELFTFSVVDVFLSDAEWVKPGKEFRMNGSLYDVVKKEYKNGRLVYRCINDKQEEDLFSELDMLVKNRMNNDSSDDYLKNLTKDFVKVFYESENVLWIPSKTVPACLIVSSFIPSSLTIFSPPPQFHS